MGQFSLLLGFTYFSEKIRVNKRRQGNFFDTTNPKKIILKLYKFASEFMANNNTCNIVYAIW